MLTLSRRGLGRVVLCWVALSLASSLSVEARQSANADARPTVRLIATGGTISNRPGGRLTATQLVATIPRLSRHVVAETEQFSNIASSALTRKDWLSLGRRINKLFAERPDLAGIVVASGTDTLEETAFFLHLTVRTDRPVVVVGAMRRPRTLGYDGSRNLLQAFQVAAAPVSRGRGVLVVLNNEINSARDVTKTSAQLLQTFSAPALGALGFVNEHGLVYHRRVEHPHTVSSEFDITHVSALPRVDVLLAYLDAPGDLLLAAVDAGADGLILAGFGAGGSSPSQREAIRQVTSSGVPVVMTTRTGSGRVSPRREAAATSDDSDPESPSTYISGADLSPIKARILLMLALTQSSDPHEIQRVFSRY